MRNKKNRLDVDTLYILGAGSSYGLSEISLRETERGKKPFHLYQTPLDFNFLNRISKTYGEKKIGWQRKSWSLLEENWIENEDFREQGLESAILTRLSHYSFLHTINKQRIKGKCSNEEFLHHLSHLLTHYLFGCRSNNSGNTSKLVEHIFPKGVGFDELKNRAITFNYDLLIDRPLLDRGLSPRKIYFDKILLSKGHVSKKEDCIHPLLLKMHGSINWRCNRSYFNSLIQDTVQQNQHTDIWMDKNCPIPTDKNSPLIIPPVPVKPITNVSVFKFLWTTAYEYLHEAKNIVIVGYSCPHTDVLARAMFSKFKSRAENITIVDPNAGILKSYREMISAPKAKWHYYSSINDYVDSFN